MALLLIGLIVWCFIHLIPAILINPRAQLINRVGEKTYRASTALLLATAIVMMVIGWRLTEPSYVYTPTDWGYKSAPAIIFISLLLFVGSNFATNLKRYIRHPQLTGTMLWGIAHLLANGDQRSIILFGGLSLWSFAEIVLISHREGTWQKPAKTPLTTELKLLITTIVVYGLVAVAHTYLMK